jgi:hypothetical protein
VPTIKVSDTKDLDALNEIINEVGDDRNNIQANDKVVLVIEDDVRFGKIMIEKAHELDLKVVVATHFGDVFDLVNKYNPDCRNT